MPDLLAANCLTVGKQKRRLFYAENTEKGICRAASRPGQAVVMDTTHLTRLSFAVSVDRNYLKSDRPSLPLISTFYAALSSLGNPHCRYPY